MKTSNYLKRAVILFLFAVPVLSSAVNGRESLMILNIESKGVVTDAETVGKMARLEFEKTGTYNVIDWFDISDALKRNNIKMDSCFGKTCVIEAAHILHADKVLLGNVERIGEKIAVILKIADGNTGEIEKTSTLEFLNLQQEIQKMIEISVKKLVGIEPDKNAVSLLIAYDQPIESPQTKMDLSGPRMGAYHVWGDAGKLMRMDEKEGGFGMYGIVSVIGWQHEMQYLSAGIFSGLVEFIFTGSGLESGRFIPAFTFKNGFRIGRQGWEFAIGPVFRFMREMDGFYAINKSDRRPVFYPEYQYSQIANDSTKKVVSEIMNRTDSRGNPTLTTALVFGIGRTFKSGYLNIPVNIYAIPRKEGWLTGLSFGFNIYKKSKG